jgi:hypothetical protein
MIERRRDFCCDPVGGILDRISREMCIPCRRLHSRMPEQLADHRQPLTRRNSRRRERVQRVLGKHTSEPIAYLDNCGSTNPVLGGCSGSATDRPLAACLPGAIFDLLGDRNRRLDRRFLPSRRHPYVEQIERDGRQHCESR